MLDREIETTRSIRRGVLLIVSGPSGVGKDTLAEMLMKVDPNLVRAVSVTTRAARATEQDGREYYFIGEDRFETLRGEGAFVETKHFAGNWYGTLRHEVNRLLDAGHDIIMRPEPDGAMAVKSAFPEAVSVFLQPPSEDELEARLRKRGTDSEEAVLARLAIARAELRRGPEFDHVVINDQLHHAFAKLGAILSMSRKANRSR